MLGVTKVFGGGWGGLGINGDFGGCWWQRQTLLSVCCLIVVAFDMVRLSGARMGVSWWFDIARLCLMLIVSMGFSEVVCDVEGIWWRCRAVGTFGCWFVINRSCDFVAGRLGVLNNMASFFEQRGVVLRHFLARLKAAEQPRCCQRLFWHIQTWVLHGFCCLWWF